MNEKMITVLGGTGKTGKQVAKQLRQQGHRVRVASRRGSTPFDWNDESSWPGIVSGAEAVYVIPPEIEGGNDRLADFSRLATGSGVQRLVLLSAREWVDVGWKEGLAREEIIRASGIGWTILRPVWFAQNFSEEPFLADGINEGELVFGTGEGRHPFIDTEDIAAVAAAALTDDAHSGQHYELTGPRAITITEAAETISAALGRPVRTHAASTEEYRSFLQERRYYSDETTDSSIELSELIRRGEDARLSYGVRRALGREPRPFAAYAQTAAEAGAWPGR